MSNKYDDISISPATKKGMTLTSDDIQFLKRMFDRQDDYIYEYINDKYQKQYDALAALIEGKMETVFKAIKDQNDEFCHALGKLDSRVQRLERYTSPWHVISRGAITILLSIIMFLLIHMKL